MIGIATERCSAEYLQEATILADDIERRTMAGDQEWDLAQYTQTLIQEVYYLRSKIAYLEGWKEGAEGRLQQPRSDLVRSTGMTTKDD